MNLYEIDTWDARLYDLVINIGKITVDDAVGFICNAARVKSFQTSPESQKQIDDLVQEAREKLKEFSLKPLFEPMRDSPWRKKE